MLADPPAVEAVLEGEEGLLGALRSDALVVDCSTIGAVAARRVASMVRNAGARYVDAPVLGSTPAAGSGTLTALAGGDPADVDRAEPLLRHFASRVVRAGEVGQGNALKLVMNLLVGGLTELLAESILLAERSGLAGDVVRGTLLDSVLTSPFVQYKAPQLLDRQLAPLFTAALMHKDLELVLEQAAASGLSLPAAHTIRDAYAATLRAGLGEQDFAAVIQALDA